MFIPKQQNTSARLNLPPVRIWQKNAKSFKCRAVRDNKNIWRHQTYSEPHTVATVMRTYPPILWWLPVGRGFFLNQIRALGLAKLVLLNVHIFKLRTNDVKPGCDLWCSYLGWGRYITDTEPAELWPWRLWRQSRVRQHIWARETNDPRT